MPEFKSAKLMISNRDGVCALCGAEFCAGIPIWWFHGKPYCGMHTEDEITTASEESVPSPSIAAQLDAVTSKFWMAEMDRMTRLICQAIEDQTREMERIWNERRP